MSTHPDCLITFLGRVPKTDGSYRTTAYDFDLRQSAPVAFFGWALRERLQPRRLLILGTAGGRWDHLFERNLELGEQAETQRLALIEGVETKDVAQLSPLADCKQRLHTRTSRRSAVSKDSILQQERQLSCN